MYDAIGRFVGQCVGGTVCTFMVKEREREMAVHTWDGLQTW